MLFMALSECILFVVVSLPEVNFLDVHNLG